MPPRLASQAMSLYRKLGTSSRSQALAGSHALGCWKDDSRCFTQLGAWNARQPGVQWWPWRRVEMC